MRIQYDREADALSIICKETTVTTRDLSEGVTGEFDASGALVGIGVLGVVQHLTNTPTASAFVPGIGLTISGWTCWHSGGIRQ